MKKKLISVVFDRKGELKKVKPKTHGIVEFNMSIANSRHKFVRYKKCTASEWATIQHSKELKDELERLENILQTMIEEGEELTILNIDKRLGKKTTYWGSREERANRARQKEKEEEMMSEARLLKSPTSFLDFFEQEYKEETLAESSVRRKRVTLEALRDFGHLRKFEDLTPRTIMRFDKWLDNGERARTTIWNYHKQVHRYALKAWKYGYIEYDPYARCDINHGRSKERRPLSEVELLSIMKHNFEGTEKEVADVFIFCAYTGLAYSDAMLFNYRTMTDTAEDYTFIDGKRLKTGSEFYTPILPHAMEVLERYHYKLPYHTNQTCNQHLKAIQKACGIKKKITFHLARHSFATLCLNHGISLELLARMMGHKNVKVTQIYAKILTETVLKGAKELVTKIK